MTTNFEVGPVLIKFPKLLFYPSLLEALTLATYIEGTPMMLWEDHKIILEDHALQEYDEETGSMGVFSKDGLDATIDELEKALYRVQELRGASADALGSSDPDAGKRKGQP